ncbi:GNAT family N-acetyltransferase [Streptomyces flavidovirens]|uniref:GNAT family N-acetyltransferase n=1 Tax=Streptomyces flavidovirens TaxID=67298 RepID=UPI0036A5DDE2
MSVLHPPEPHPAQPRLPRPRAAVAADIDELIRLRGHLLGPPSGSGSGGAPAPYRATGPEQERAWRESYRRWLGKWLEADGPVLVVVVSEPATGCSDPGRRKLLACATAVVDERAPSPACLSGRAGWIQSVVVDPAARGQGLGSEIVRYAVRRLKDQGADEVFLQTTPEANRLYRRAGFAPTGEDLLFKVLDTPLDPAAKETSR